MNLLQTLSHAGEEHSSTVSEIAHRYPDIIVVPSFVLAVAGIGYITYLITSRNFGNSMFVVAVILFFSGFAFAQDYPLVSVLSLTVGLVLAMMLAFGGLSGSGK